MGDYRSIAAVTRTLVQLVQDGINRSEGDVARATVTTSRPDRTEANPQPRVNIFLFHVVPNPFLRNDDLPLRTQSGLVRRPAVALDLYYLFTFYGAEEIEKLEPQLLMGATMSALNAHPILTPDDILRAAALFETPVDDRFLIQQVQLTIHTISVEELSRLWGTFPQVPYALSVCYRASAVIVEADEIPAPALPLRGTSTQAAATLPPAIASIRGEGGGVTVFGGALEITGKNFAGDKVLVVLGGAVLQPSSVTAGSVTVTAGGKDAGGKDVAAGLQWLYVARDGFLSQPVEIALAPVLVELKPAVKADGSGGFGGSIRLTLQPSVQPGQSVSLELFPLRASARDTRRSYRFDWAEYERSGRSRSRLSVPVRGVAAGAYMARVVVDGAATVLTQGPDGRYDGPVISIGAPSARSS